MKHELLLRRARYKGRRRTHAGPGGGAIVSVASVNAFFQPDGGTIDYGAAKAALVNFTKALSRIGRRRRP